MWQYPISMEIRIACTEPIKKELPTIITSAHSQPLFYTILLPLYCVFHFRFFFQALSKTLELLPKLLDLSVCENSLENDRKWLKQTHTKTIILCIELHHREFVVNSKPFSMSVCATNRKNVVSKNSNSSSRKNPTWMLGSHDFYTCKWHTLTQNSG